MTKEQQKTVNKSQAALRRWENACKRFEISLATRYRKEYINLLLTQTTK